MEEFKSKHGEAAGNDLAKEKSVMSYQDSRRVLFLLQDKDLTSE